MVNPPFYSERSVRAAPDRARAAAHVMGEGALAAWVRFFAAMAAPNGLLTMIHRPDRLAELLALLEGRFGSVAVFPLFPRSGEAATRIIVQAKKGSRAGLSLLPGLVLHDGAGGYTEAAEAVLRGGAALKLRGSSEG
jgi:tRNA1(Val) A37 N6-methylase TrmN6